MSASSRRRLHDFLNGYQTGIPVVIPAGFRLAGRASSCGSVPGKVALEEAAQVLLHVGVVLFEADGFGGDFLKLRAGDEPVHLDRVFVWVDGVETVGQDE
jgi:hypothetical protein